MRKTITLIIPLPESYNAFSLLDCIDRRLTPLRSNTDADQRDAIVGCTRLFGVGESTDRT